MATSIAIIIIFGLLVNFLFEKIKLPGLLGMLFLGVLIGPYCLKIISPDLISASADFRKIALIVILLRAGLSIKKQDLLKVGRPALLMSFVPALFEGLAVAAAAKYFMNIPIIEALMLGFILAAVSPAVVVPQMIYFSKRGIGKENAIPTMLIASSSMDNVFAITVFTAFLSIYLGKGGNLAMKILSIPVSILLGIVLGVIIGLVLCYLFKKYHIRDTKKVLTILGLGILLTALETYLKDIIEIASLIGVITIGFVLLYKIPEKAVKISLKFDKIWVFAEIFLFVLVGSQVNVVKVYKVGAVGILVILIGLVARSIGVIISTGFEGFNFKEKLFCIIAYVPKATVQAAIAAIPLSFFVPSGETILAIAVLAIIITAPIGAIGINKGAKRLL